MAGTLTLTTLSDGTNSTSATNCIQGSAKAWVNFAGATGTINGSYNVSSVTRNATGYYTVTFTSALPNANYSGVGTSSAGSVGQLNSCNMFGINSGNYYQAPTTSSFTVYFSQTNNFTAIDPVYCCLSVFR